MDGIVLGKGHKHVERADTAWIAGNGSHHNTCRRYLVRELFLQPGPRRREL